MDGPGSYTVEVDGAVREIQQLTAQRDEHRAADLIDPHAPPKSLTPRDLFRPVALLWRAFIRLLERLGPDDPPRVIAIIKAPSRMYCSDCGTERVARFCPICGQDVDRQYRKMVLTMARYVVDGTSERREAIEAALARRVEEEVARLAADQQRQIEQRLLALERGYIVEIVKQRKRIQELASVAVQPALPEPARPQEVMS